MISRPRIGYWLLFDTFIFPLSFILLFSLRFSLYPLSFILLLIAFTELPFAQQQQLYHAAARRVLEEHGLDAASLTALTFVNNATFQARAGDRELAVRIYRPRQSSGRAIRSELEWLRALSEQTALSVPRPLATP